jgi:predicted nucleic acid-binding protein
MPEVVLDASAAVDLLIGSDIGKAIRRRIVDCTVHAPSHMDGEVLSALGRMHRAGDLSEGSVEVMLKQLQAVPIRRHSLGNLLMGAWSRRHQLRLVDALYVELAVSQGIPLVTTDGRLGWLDVAEVIA